jgi:hypothetical protein
MTTSRLFTVLTEILVRVVGIRERVGSFQRRLVA